MNKIYTFLVIIPVIAILFFKTLSFYEFDTKQRYIKNTVDSAAHKVMITGVMTAGDKEELVRKLGRMGKFQDNNITLKYGEVESDGTLAQLNEYALGTVLDRGEIFGIYVESEDESNISRMEGNSGDEENELHYKAKATCRVEKSRQED
jgi:hypothetical protein